eukprot:Skav210886  [mRNA]  locus=scaffold3713:104179:110902:+ [translate_table: standard]
MAAQSCLQERLCSDDPLGRGFALVDGQHLGLGPLLTGPLLQQDRLRQGLGTSWGDWPLGLEDAMCSAEERVTLRRLSGQALQIQAADGASRKELQGWVWALDADLPSKLAISGSADTSLMLWDLERLELLRSFEGHSGAVCCVSADFPRKWAVSGSDDGTLRLWSFNQRSELQTLRGRGTAWCLVASCEYQAAATWMPWQAVLVGELETQPRRSKSFAKKRTQWDI